MGILVLKKLKVSSVKCHSSELFSGNIFAWNVYSWETCLVSIRLSRINSLSVFIWCHLSNGYNLIGSIQIYIGLPSLWQDIDNIWSVHVPVIASSFNSYSINDYNSVLWWRKWASYAIHSYCSKARMLQRS